MNKRTCPLTYPGTIMAHFRISMLTLLDLGTRQNRIASVLDTAQSTSDPQGL